MFVQTETLPARDVSRPAQSSVRNYNITMRQILVVGGGISGLTIAWRLQQRQPLAHVHVWESSHRLGGAIWTDTNNGFVIEHGPNGFLDNKPHMLDLANDLGLSSRLIPGSEAARKHRYLFLNSQLRELPNSLFSFIRSDLLSWCGKLRLLAEPLVPARRRAKESVAAFATRRFGREAAEVFIDPLVTGIHAGDPDLLDVRAAFPRLSNWESTTGSVVGGMLRARRQHLHESSQKKTQPAPRRMWSFPNGLREIIEALAGRLQHPPRCNQAVVRIENDGQTWIVSAINGEHLKADAVIMACPAYIQANLLRSVDPILAKLVGSIEYNRIVIVALAFQENDVPHRPEGFGFITPQRTRRDILGAQWCSSIFTERAPKGMVLWRVLCGGWNRPDLVDWPDHEILQAVQAELQLAHGVRSEPVLARIIRWPRGLPQYLLGHPERVRQIENQAAQHFGLFLAGNAYRGIALNDCVENANQVADAVGRYLHATGTGHGFHGDFD